MDDDKDKIIEIDWFAMPKLLLLKDTFADGVGYRYAVIEKQTAKTDFKRPPHRMYGVTDGNMDVFYKMEEVTEKIVEHHEELVRLTKLLK